MIDHGILVCSPKCSDEPKLFFPCFANRFQWFNPSAGCAAEATLWLARGFSDFAGPTWIAFHVGDSCVANSEPPGGFHGFHYGFHFLCPPSILDGIPFFKWSRLILIHFRDPNGLTFCQGGWTLYWAPLCRAQNQEIVHGRLKRCLSSPFYTFLKTIKIQKKTWITHIISVITVITVQQLFWQCRTAPGQGNLESPGHRRDLNDRIGKFLCQGNCVRPQRGVERFCCVKMIVGWDYYELLWSNYDNYGKTAFLFFFQF